MPRRLGRDIGVGHLDVAGLGPVGLTATQGEWSASLLCCRQAALGWLTPIEFEAIVATPASEAA
jgi:hypothetical protein